MPLVHVRSGRRELGRMTFWGMAFPPKPPFPPKPSAKQWAGGPPKPSFGGPPEAPPPGSPQAPPGPKVAPDGKTPPPPMAKVPGEDPQMIARAHQAIGRLIMEGGLPKDVIDSLAKANQRLIETQHGPGSEPAAEDAAAQDPKADPPKGKEEAADTDGTSCDSAEKGAMASAPAKKQFPPKQTPPSFQK